MVKIRKAKREDLQGVYNLFLELCDSEDSSELKIAKHLKSMRKRRPDFEKSAKRALLKSISDRKALYLVAENEGELLGYGYGTVLSAKDSFFISQKIGCLNALVVSRKHRGKGVASGLHAELLDWFRKKGCSSASLEVFTTNAAQDIYKKWGYSSFTCKMNKKLK
ncbi:MAG: GNAT family N-acetyltransferase [Candidatus Woesearchaeota archaeon]